VATLTGTLIRPLVEPRWGRLPLLGARCTRSSRTGILGTSPAPIEVGLGHHPWFLRAWVASTSLRDDPTVPDSIHQPLPQRQFPHPCGPLGLSRLPSAAADLILLGDLTGRYATGSYSRLASDTQTLALRGDRQGAAEHGHRMTAAIACHVARAGGTVDQLTQFLLHPEHEGGRHARHIALHSGQSRALDYIRRVRASASAAVGSTRVLESRHDAYEVLAALRDRIETTPWRGERGRTALRVLRAHLNFAETAGGPLHHAGERCRRAPTSRRRAGAADHRGWRGLPVRPAASCSFGPPGRAVRVRSHAYGGEVPRGRSDDRWSRRGRPVPGPTVRQHTR
jgi:hypothetical protein